MALQVFLVRHGIAEDREVFKKSAQSDDLRPLTKEGEHQFKKVAKALRTLTGDVDLIATSPLKRAQQTAAILKKRYPDAHEIVINELKPGRSSMQLLNWLRSVRSAKIILVGHEPSLGEHFTYFLTGRRHSACDIKKGGFCAVEFADRREKGTAKLLCCIQPSQIKKLRRDRN